MKKLFTYANEYVNQSDWKVLALLKLCLAAIGVLIGLEIPRKYKKSVFFGAMGVFVITYIPLMAKFFRIVRETDNE